MPARNAHCDRTRDAGLYVLGELRGAQLDSFARHLRHCERCGEEVDLLELASDAVPLLTARHLPPPPADEPDVRLPTLAAAAAASRTSLGAGASASASGGTQDPAAQTAQPHSARPALRPIPGGAADRPHPPARPSARRLIKSPVPRVGLVGFMAVAVLAIATVMISSEGASIHYKRIKAGWSSGGAALKLEGNGLQLLVEDMPKPANGSGYQIWIVDRARNKLTPTSAWIHLNQLGQAGTNVPGNYHQWDAIAVYVEPINGRDTTNSGAVVVGDLRHVS